MVSNKLPSIMEDHGPFRIRYNRLRYSSRIENLSQERVIATLYIWMHEKKKAKFSKKDGTISDHMTLNYNKEKALIIPYLKKRKIRKSMSLERASNGSKRKKKRSPTFIPPSIP